MTQALRHFLLALQFFTRIPITGRLAAWVGYSPALLRAAAAYFPAVGWLVGMLAAFVMVLMLSVLPDENLGFLLAAALSTAATVWLTGAFHEDGLADTADGLGGGLSRERALAIMKDSRIGSYGSITLVLAVLIKLLLLAMLAGQGALVVGAALVGAHALSRLAPLVVMRSLPYVSDEGQAKSKPLADAVSGQGFRIGFVWSLPALPLLGLWVGGWSLLLALLLWALALAWWLRVLGQRLQGFTGDTLGAVQQVTELAVYLGLVLGLGLAA